VEGVTTTHLDWNFVANGLMDVEHIAANGAVFFRKIKTLSDGKGVLFGLERGADRFEADIW
jgi:hypothetical protein